MKELNLLFGVILMSCMTGSAGHSAVFNVPGDYATIQAGIFASDDGDTVIVADGTYTGEGNRDLVLGGRSIHVLSVNGSQATVIDCESLGRGFRLYSSGDSGSMIRGFTIKNGAPEIKGGGMEIGYGVETTVVDCMFQDNTVTGDSALGCGMSVENNAVLTLKNCTFTGNHTDNYNGSGIALILGSNSNVMISGCVFSNNIGTGLNSKGGAIRIGSNAVALTISNCLFDGNQAAYGGALSGGHLKNFTITNCLFINNMVKTGGSAIDLYDWEPFTEMIIRNCTFADNSLVYSNGAVIDMADVLDLQIKDSIFWNNTPAQIVYTNIAPTVSYSDVQGSWPGTGNIDTDPLFCPGPFGNYYLSHTAAGEASDSPCIDTGSIQASDVCYSIAEGLRCMDELTTRSDIMVDTGQVDLGMHFESTLCIRHGDVDFSGELTAGDAQTAFAIVLGAITPTLQEECAADCNGDGTITAADAQSIFGAVLGYDPCIDPIPESF